jgi:hypothetical protein
MLPYDLYPVMLGYWDVLLAPLKDDEFNQSKSDIKCVDAVAKSIPFLASPVQPYWDFGPHGGSIVPDTAWEKAIENIITHEDLRLANVESGRSMAEEREMGQLVMKWFSAIRSLL